MALRDKNGQAIKLQRPNPIGAQMEPIDGWMGGSESNFDELGLSCVERMKISGVSSVQEMLRLEKIREDRANKIEKDRVEGKALVDNPEDPEMLRNRDGSPLTLNCSTANMFDPSNPDHDLMDSVDQEVIEQGGGPVEYYKVIVDSRVDPLYHEQRNKAFAQKPISLTASWEPTPPVLVDIIAGWNPEENMVFSFNRKDFLEKVGEMPRDGSIIRTCDDGIFWEIVTTKVNVQGEDRKLWGKHRLAVTCIKYQSTITDASPSGQGRESAVVNKRPITIR